jgi:hypothetical protein
LPLASLIPFLLFGLTGCGSWTINYRLTLDVDVDGELHTGSSVVETQWHHTPEWLQGLSSVVWNVGVHGEAVVVDLGSRGLLFGLLTGAARYDSGNGKRFYPSDPYWIIMNFGVAERGGITPHSLDVLATRRDTIELPFSALPMLVRFRDVSDPMSVVQVEPRQLDASFGPGVRLVRATLAITNDPVTTGIEDWLRWLRDMQGHLNGQRYHVSNDLAGTLGIMSFKR